MSKFTLKPRPFHPVKHSHNVVF